MYSVALRVTRSIRQRSSRDARRDVAVTCRGTRGTKIRISIESSIAIRTRTRMRARYQRARGAITNGHSHVSF
jgi:hypothetical protein